MDSLETDIFPQSEEIISSDTQLLPDDTIDSPDVGVLPQPETISGEIQPIQQSTAVSPALDAVVKIYVQGDYNTALSQFRSLQNTNSYAELYIGNCLYKLNNPKDAETAWLSAAENLPDSSKPHINLGNLYYAQDLTDKAILHWHKALTCEPDSEAANYNIAVAYSDKNCRELAIYYYERFIKYYKNDFSEPNYCRIKEFISTIKSNADSFSFRATEYYEARNFHKFIECYLKAIHNYPCGPNLSQYVGHLFYKLKKYSAALDYWLISYRTDPERSRCLINIAIAYYKLKKYNYAYCFYRRALAKINDMHQHYDFIITQVKDMAGKLEISEKAAKIHLELAHEHEANSFYQKAVEEYENYLFILNRQDAETLLKIQTLNEYLFPEKTLINWLMHKLRSETDSENSDEIIDICNRILLVAPAGSKEYDLAYVRKNRASR